MRWLIAQWPYATLFAAAFLLVLVPPFLAFISIPLLLVYLQLPAYMVHQFEEHDQDRFRIFINQTLAGGRNALTPGATFSSTPPVSGAWISSPSISPSL